VLVIGMHREELAFGERVAARVDPRMVAVLRVPDGLSGRRPRADERFLYDTRHRELYLQLLPHVLRRYRLLIDLHTGIDERGGPCADVICADAGYLDCVAGPSARGDGRLSGEEVRPVLLMASAGPERRRPGEVDAVFAETTLPRRVWDNSAFTYVGLEVYLSAPGAGAPEAWTFAAVVIDRLTRCAGLGGKVGQPVPAEAHGRCRARGRGGG
jgi:hypothetical protein